MNFAKAHKLVTFKTGKLDSNAAEENGRYPFFTCAQTTYRINTHAFDTECVLLAGNNAGGIFPLKYYKGKFNAYQRTYVIEPRQREQLSIKYFYFFLRPYLKAFEQQATGATTKFLTLKILNGINVPLPDIKIQQKIAAILSTYDELIENNQRRIALLEKMAEEIYREWFVRLRFPGHEKVKKVKSLPEGWEVESLGCLLAEIIDYRGITPAKLNSNWENKGIIALSALNVKNGRLIKLEDAGRVSEALYERWMRKKLEPFDILLTSEAPLGQVYMLMDSEKYVLSQRLFGLRANPKRISPCYLYHYLLFPIGQNQLIARATGSTVGGIRQQLLKQVEVIVPAESLLKTYTEIVQPMFKCIYRLSQQNDLLTKSRDLLLPRLISGKLSVEHLDIQFPPGMEDRP